MPFLLLGVASGIAALGGKLFHDSMAQNAARGPELLDRREWGQVPENPGRLVQGVSNENLALGAGFVVVTLLAMKG